MSFWKSVEHIARKKHMCELCHKAIQVGERYSRQTGVADGDFHDYCLCLRCLWLLKQHPGREFIGGIWELLSDYDYISCLNCGAYNYEIEEVDDDIEKLTFSCDSCGHKWPENLSLEALKKREQEQVRGSTTKCKECHGSGVVKEYDDLDRYYVHVCHICNGTGEVQEDEP